MKLTGLGLSYLILRELPIRNFYARSVVMAAFLYKISKSFRFNLFDLSLEDNSQVMFPKYY